MPVAITALNAFPEVSPGDDLRRLISEAAAFEGSLLDRAAIVAVAQKVVSKAEGAVVDLKTIQPGPLARSWAHKWNKDARVIEVVFSEAKRIVKMDRGVIIAETRHGFVCANAGVDQSNVPTEECVTILPKDPDLSARRLWQSIGCGAVIVTDTFGRPWREGLVDVAIGCAGLEALGDCRGKTDRYGRKLESTIIAVADQLAAAAGMLMSKAAGRPVVIIEGFAWTASESGATTLLRIPERDLFR